MLDGRLGFGNSTLAALEAETSFRFDVKAREMALPMKFNGCVVVLHQNEYAQSLSKISPSRFTPEEFGHLRGQVAYISSNTRPDTSRVSAQLARVKVEDASPSDVRLLSAAAAHLKAHSRGILFTRLDLSTLVIRGYSNAAFAHNENSTSQLGMVIVLFNAHGHANILHYASWKSRRITRSILAAEMYAFSACYDYALTAAHDLSSMLGQTIPINLFKDSKLIFGTITKLSGVSKKRFFIDIAALRQAYTSGEIENIGHIFSARNMADSLSKKIELPDCH